MLNAQKKQQAVSTKQRAEKQNSLTGKQRKNTKWVSSYNVLIEEGLIR